MTILSNKPKLRHGSFREYLGLLRLDFQFNPLEITRNRSLSFSAPGVKSSDNTQTSDDHKALRQYHQEFDDLNKLRENQIVTFQEETLSFDIRLNAKDSLVEGKLSSGVFGVGPQLSALELMVHPKEELTLGRRRGFAFTEKEKPPMILFIWGRFRVLPVNINSINIKESDFSPNLDPVEASVTVNLTVIEGPNTDYLVTQTFKEVSNASKIVDLVVPGF